jgi:hydrogenase maturation factor
MSAYVLGCHYRRAENDSANQTPGHDVDYSSLPVWVFETYEAAWMNCGMINTISVHVGQHYCQFDVEKLDENKFAIVCESHPELAGA